jgi:signal peptidase I
MDSLTIPPRNSEEQKKLMQTHEHHTQQLPEKETRDEDSNDSFITEIFKFAVLAILIVVPFRFYIAQPFIVSGASMSPTFHTGEYLIVDQLSYRLNPPQRGDVVIFKYPNDPSKYFIKRIIGLPGEIVKLANGITTIVNTETQEEFILDEEYLVTDKTDDHLSITLSSTEYFVMGDNRSASSDSRVWGPVPSNDIVGRAFLRLLPVNTFSLFPGAYTYTTDATVQELNAEPATN